MVYEAWNLWYNIKISIENTNNTGYIIRERENQ